MRGGPSLIATTSPRFEASFELWAGDEAAPPLPFHADSPAGGLWRRLESHLVSNLASNVGSSRVSNLGSRRFAVRWHDPHGGGGGLGASTAQFACVLAFGEACGAWELGLLPRSAVASNSAVGSAPDSARAENLPSANRIVAAAAPNWRLVLELYRACAWSGEGTPPSGADLVAQLTGGVCAFDGEGFSARVFAWAFPDLELTLLRTGAKLATHEHLKTEDGLSWPIDELRKDALAAIEATAQRDSAVFLPRRRFLRRAPRESGIACGAYGAAAERRPL